MGLKITDDARRRFFDGIAETWDLKEDLPRLRKRFSTGLDRFAIEPNETVLDVGCGTGNLTAALLGRLSKGGRVVAVDISKAMLSVAQTKIGDPRVTWLQADAKKLPLDDSSLDRIICCSVWPHFQEPKETAAELRRVLRRGGMLHVWHPLPRWRVNRIHADAGEAVRNDLLAPAGEVAILLKRCGFDIRETIDTSEKYLVTAATGG